MSEPLIVGIRHHSPACARLVKSLIESQRPRYVLIEGPADFNDRVDELFLAHQLPVAIYSYCQYQDGAAPGRGAWTPFAEFSPECSMVDSVIHSAVMAACLWQLPGIRTHLVAFDTSVVDLTADVADPVELLMKVQLGGGTNIASAVEYGRQLIEQPAKSVIILVSDFYEGGSSSLLTHQVKKCVQSGIKVLGLAALDSTATPCYDHDTAQALVNVGAQIAAMTPGELASWLAENLQS